MFDFADEEEKVRGKGKGKTKIIQHPEIIFFIRAWIQPDNVFPSYNLFLNRIFEIRIQIRP